MFPTLNFVSDGPITRRVLERGAVGVVPVLGRELAPLLVRELDPERRRLLANLPTGTFRTGRAASSGPCARGDVLAQEADEAADVLRCRVESRAPVVAEKRIGAEELRGPLDLVRDVVPVRVLQRARGSCRRIRFRTIPIPSVRSSERRRRTSTRRPGSSHGPRDQRASAARDAEHEDRPVQRDPVDAAAEPAR